MVQPDSPQDVAIQVWHNEHVKLGRILDHIQAHCVQVHLIKFNIFTVFCNFPAFLQKKPI